MSFWQILFSKNLKYSVWMRFKCLIFTCSVWKFSGVFFSSLESLKGIWIFWFWSEWLNLPGTPFVRFLFHFKFNWISIFKWKHKWKNIISHFLSRTTLESSTWFAWGRMGSVWAGKKRRNPYIFLAAAETKAWDNQSKPDLDCAVYKLAWDYL